MRFDEAIRYVAADFEAAVKVQGVDVHVVVDDPASFLLMLGAKIGWENDSNAYRLGMKTTVANMGKHTKIHFAGIAAK